MVKVIIIFSLLLFSNFLSTFSQSPIQIWNESSNLAKNKQWALVVEKIKPHIFPAPNDTLTPWLIQLYAYSSFMNGDQISAFVSADRILNEYPSWNRIAETNLLLGHITFNKKKLKQAIHYWKNLPILYQTKLVSIIKFAKFKISMDSINAFNLDSTLSDTQFLKAINQISESLKEKKTESVLRIGILLPFDLKLNTSKNSETASYDFYRGVLLASEVMAASDSSFEVYAFDFQNSSTQFEKLLTGPSLNGLDMIIGPLKLPMLTKMESWANSKKILVINPLSNQSFDSPNSFLHTQQPSFSTISNAVFEFVSKTSIGSKAGIIFGPEKNDSLLADSYKKILKKMGRELVLFKKVGKNSAANLTKFLVESGLDSTSHLFVANNEPLVRAQLPGAYSWTKAKFPVVVFGKWIESSTADYDEYQRLPFYFVGSDLPNYDNPQWHNWKESYILKWGIPPNWIAWKGFDLAISLAKNLYSFNSIEQKTEEHLLPKQSELFGKYQFSGFEMDNKYVPIFKVDAHFFRKVWPE